MAGKKDKGKAPSVPAGWKAHWDTESNNWYYENIYTKDTVWEKPTEPAYPIQDVSSIEEGDEAVKLLTSRESISRTEEVTETTGVFKVPAGVCALLVDKYSTGNADITVRSRAFRVASPNGQGWIAIAVDKGDILVGHVQLYQYKHYS